MERDEVRTALAVIVARGMSDELVAKAAVVLGREIERMGAIEGRAVQFLNRQMPDADVIYADGYHAACDDILTYHHGGMRAEVERLRAAEARVRKLCDEHASNLITSVRIESVMRALHGGGS